MVLAVQDIALVEPRAGPLGTDTLVDAGDLTPRHCVLLRAGGLMSLLDMDKGEGQACRQLLLQKQLQHLQVHAACSYHCSSR